MPKKALSPLIATILLIGVSIVLAVFIFGWGQGWFIGLTEQTGEKSLTDADLLNRIHMKVDAYAEGNRIKGTITNTGQIDFESVKLNVIGIRGTKTINLGQVSKGNTLTIPEQSVDVGDIKKVITVPSVNIGGKTFFASNVAVEKEPDYGNWKIIGHDKESRYHVIGYEPPTSHQVTLTYEIPEQEIRDLIASATEVKQYIFKECKGSGIWPNGNPYSSWVDFDGDRITAYWPEGSSQCDKNDYIWRSNGGYITNKNDLPIKKVYTGDTGNSNEEAYITIGKLWIKP